jgi:FkbM family methyltransferase
MPIIKNSIPEGTFKQGLRDIRDNTIYFFKFHALLHNKFNIRYHPREKMFELLFIKGALQGLTINFPYIPRAYMAYISTDVLSYFDKIRMRKESVVVDVGAYPGDFTVAAASIADKGRVIAIEPDPDNLCYLEKTLALNNKNNKVEVLPYALWDTNSSAEILQNRTCSAIRELTHYPANKLKPYVEVKTRTLDSILEERGILKDKSHLFIKMDIEGAELKAIQGAEKTISRGAVFAIAAYHVVNGKKTFEPLQELFLRNNYTVEKTESSHVVLIAEPRD